MFDWYPIQISQLNFEYATHKLLKPQSIGGSWTQQNCVKILTGVRSMFLQAVIPVVVHFAAEAEFESVVANPLNQSRLSTGPICITAIPSY